jgi:transposase
MKVILERVAAGDVHRDMVKVCGRRPGAAAEREEWVQTFPTHSAGLLALRDWLKALEVTHVALESTGVYWKPIYYVLENDFQVLLVNAAHAKNVPGRKTDTADCCWLAQLLECGLLKASFIPPPPLRALREVARYRIVQTQERAREVQRLHAVLQDAGIKLSSVATDIRGVSGRAMIDHLVEGQADPEALSQLARGQLRAKLPQLRQALAGHFNRHHAFLVAEILAHVDYLEESLARLSQRVEELLRPFEAEAQRLQTIPGVGVKTAQVMVAEFGVDMSKFPTRKHLGAWSGLCPGQHQSAGRRKTQRTRPGNRWLRSACMEAAWAAVREGDNYLAAQYHRLVGRRGKKKAIVAVAHSMVEIAHTLLSRQVNYRDLGADYFLRLNRQVIERRCVHQLQKLGYHVTLTPETEAA